MAGEGGGLFAGFRVLGRFSGHVPHVLRYHGRHREFYLATAVGRSVHTYNVSTRPCPPRPHPSAWPPGRWPALGRPGPRGASRPGAGQGPAAAPLSSPPTRPTARPPPVVRREPARRAPGAGLGGRRGCSPAGGWEQGRLLAKQARTGSLSRVGGPGGCLVCVCVSWRCGTAPPSGGGAPRG